MWEKQTSNYLNETTPPNLPFTSRIDYFYINWTKIDHTQLLNIQILYYELQAVSIAMSPTSIPQLILFFSLSAKSSFDSGDFKVWIFNVYANCSGLK